MKVSGKGQIVIPAEYRERLNIGQGMKVKFSIRGNVLIVELDTDVTKDIQYLKEMKGVLGEEDLDETQSSEIIYDLLSQQFYHGTDVLTDRVGRDTYKIRGADSIVQETVKILVHSARHWLDGQYVDTLLEFADNLEIDFASLISRFNNKIRNMTIDPTMIKMMGGEVVFAMAIGEVLTQFRTRIGDETQEKIIKEAEILGFNSRLGTDTVEDAVITRLADRYSILMNLRVLREMARCSIKSVGSRLFDKISKQLLEELEQLETPPEVIARRKRRDRRRKKKGSKPETREKLPERKPLIEGNEKQTELNLPDGEEEDVDFDLPELPSMDEYQ